MIPVRPISSNRVLEPSSIPEGVINFRDLGGTPGGEGLLVRRGKVFRSAELACLTEAGADQLGKLGVAFIFDLRSNRERASRPSPPTLDSTMRFLWRDYELSGGDLNAITEDRAANADTFRALMIAAYRRLPFEQSTAITTILRLIASGDGPLLFHCAAGKDRTGITAAILLDLLGTPRDHIFNDFTRTNDWLEPNRARFLQNRRRKSVDDAIWEPLLLADPDYLTAMFDELTRRAGGVSGYVAGLGILPEEIAALRANLLEP